MKSKDELKALKTECENLNKKLTELTEEEFEFVTGGFASPTLPEDDNENKNTPNGLIPIP